jgi:RES domain-containing protein
VLTVYRIADGRHKVFDSTGAMLQGGRWNSPGRAVIYCALSYAGAMLEQLVHANTGRVPKNQKYVVISIPESVSVERRSRDELLKGWETEDYRVSRAIGDAWVASGRSAVLLVPSVVAEMETDVLVNPAHSQFKLIRVSKPRAVKWDERLFRKRPVRERQGAPDSIGGAERALVWKFGICG